MPYIKLIKNAVSGVLTTAVLIAATLSTHSHANWIYGRVNVLNSPLNVRDCASSSCRWVGRMLRDESYTFEGPYSSNSWLKIPHLGAYGNAFANDYVYGSYIKEGRDSLRRGYHRSYQATTTASLNLREGPMVQYDRITTIPNGAEITVTGENGHYLNVYWRPDLHQFTRPIIGYVHSAYVKRK
jgi:uncharacterized protein YgiM (DUF1202 family)